MKESKGNSPETVRLYFKYAEASKEVWKEIFNHSELFKKKNTRLNFNEWNRYAKYNITYVYIPSFHQLKKDKTKFD